MQKLIRIIYMMMKKKVVYELPELKTEAVS